MNFNFFRRGRWWGRRRGRRWRINCLDDLIQRFLYTKSSDNDYYLKKFNSWKLFEQKNDCKLKTSRTTTVKKNAWPILKTLLLHPKVVRDSRCRCPNIFSRSRRQTLHHLTSKYEMCDQIRKTQFLSQIKECVNNNFCISVEFYIVLCTVFQLCFCDPSNSPIFQIKFPPYL